MIREWWFRVTPDQLFLGLLLIFLGMSVVLLGVLVLTAQAD